MTSEHKNGHATDEGLIVIRESFRGAEYLSDEAKECAELLMTGAHRSLEIPDSAAMEIYGLITQGKKVELSRTGSSGKGYVARIETYTELIDFFRGRLPAGLVDG